MSESHEPHVVVHTDGACSGNPGPGGWGAILEFGNHKKELKGGEAHTTNNRMELMAAISALEALKRPCLVDIHTEPIPAQRHHELDQQVEGQRLAHRRQVAGQERRPVKRLDAALLAQHRVRWHWVKAIPATRSTSAPTSSRAKQSRRCGRGCWRAGGRAAAGTQEPSPARRGEGRER